MHNLFIFFNADVFLLFYVKSNIEDCMVTNWYCVGCFFTAFGHRHVRENDITNFATLTNTDKKIIRYQIGKLILLNSVHFLIHLNVIHSMYTQLTIDLLCVFFDFQANFWMAVQRNRMGRSVHTQTTMMMQPSKRWHRHSINFLWVWNVLPRVHIVRRASNGYRKRKCE